LLRILLLVLRNVKKILQRTLTLSGKTHRGRRHVAVQTCYYQSENGRDDSFFGDVLASLLLASAHGDKFGAEKLWDLWVVHLETNLAAMSPDRLEQYFTTRQAWRWFGSDPVLKTVDTPCVAYIRYRSSSTLMIVGMGACYQYPPAGEEAWWQGVILPRLRRL
jgi:hypothetical protein